MPRPYSEDLRWRAIWVKELLGFQVNEVAAALWMSRTLEALIRQRNWKSCICNRFLANSSFWYLHVCFGTVQEWQLLVRSLYYDPELFLVLFFFSPYCTCWWYWLKIDDIYACVFAKQVHYKVSYLFVSVRSSVCLFVCLFVSKEKIFVCKFKFSSSFSTFLSKSIEVTVYRVSITLTKKQ